MLSPWQEILMYTVKNRKGKLAIYPFGEMGLRIKHFLNDILGIKEEIRIDKCYSEFTDYVISVETLEEIDGYQDYVYIIASILYPFAQELTRRGVPEENIVCCCDVGGYLVRYNAYEEAILSIISKIKPASIYDANVFWGNKLGKSLYSEIRCRETLLTDIDLYADRNKIEQLFPAQRKIYDKWDQSSADMILCIDGFDHTTRELTNNLEHKIVAVVSRVPVIELEESVKEKFMYSYLYVYIFH